MPDPQDLRPGAMASRAPTVLYLIRHCAPADQHLDSYYGQIDVPLGDPGKEHSCRVAERLANVPFDAIYASDLQRAGHLADLLAEPRELPVRRLEVFRERCMGTLQGKTKAELLRDHAAIYNQWLADRIYYRVPEAENFEDLRARVMPAVMDLVAAFKGLRIALVCHAGPIRVAVAHALGMPLENIFRLAVDHGGIYVIEFPHSGDPRVRLMNG